MNNDTLTTEVLTTEKSRSKSPKYKRYQITIECCPNVDLKITYNELYPLELTQKFNHSAVISQYVSYYACIRHDCDIKEDGVTKKRPHIHLVIELRENKSKRWLLDTISKILVIDKNRITMQNCDSLIYATQYLTHFNSPEKYQYDIQGIYTNDFRRYNDLMESEDDINSLTIDRVIELCETCNLREIYCKIGLENSRRYRQVINDIYWGLRKE